MSSFELNAYIGRPTGRKNAEVHLYRDLPGRQGHPLRLCDWMGMDEEVERVEGPVTCRHCLNIQQGGRKVAFE